MDINDLMNYVPLKKSTIYSKVSRKQIPYRKIGKKLIFNKIEINNWINNSGKHLNTEEDFPTLNI
ncbi:helix-turn-helix transcriptional regulator [Chryseobacterium scophthalmum]|uniref:helix-turn-helix transcriptional regulator n=1 Tax=Chryseobacterium scophthalmum TaxID=59733 RepID=UPI003D7C2B6C